MWKIETQAIKPQYSATLISHPCNSVKNVAFMDCTTACALLLNHLTLKDSEDRQNAPKSFSKQLTFSILQEVFKQ
jgi:hypothetical protein